MDETAIRSVLPAAPAGTTWELEAAGDTVRLRLRTSRRFGKGRLLSSWGTQSFSGLAPDPLTSIARSAAGMVASRTVAVAA